MKRLTFALGCLLAAGCAPGAPRPVPLNPVRFLLTSNVTGKDTMPDGTGGLARLATIRRRIADQGPVLFVAAGNILFDGSRTPQPGMVAALNAAKLDYATFAREELMLPYDTLVARVAGAKFKWLSSNCAAANAAGTQPIPGVMRWDTLRVSKHKVAIFGLTQAGTYGTGSTQIRCGTPDSTVYRTIDSLVAGGAELVVALTYQPTEDDQNLLLRESRLDLILGGGHETKAQNTAVDERHVLKADANARTAQFVTLWGGKGQWRQAVGLVPVDARLPADSAVVQAGNTKPD